MSSFKHATKKDFFPIFSRDAFLEARLGDSLVLAWTWKKAMHCISHLL